MWNLQNNTVKLKAVKQWTLLKSMLLFTCQLSWLFLLFLAIDKGKEGGQFKHSKVKVCDYGNERMI